MGGSPAMTIVRLGPHQFVHVLDNNSNVTRVLCGPMTYTRLDQEVVLHTGPQNCIAVPPYSYCIVRNPVDRDENGEVKKESNGTVKVRLGDEEIRFDQDPFPLYPSEELALDVTPLTILTPVEAIKVRSMREFVDKDNQTRRAGDEWIVAGPCTYIPRVEVMIVERIAASVLTQNQAMKIRAVASFVDRLGVSRKAGEEWLHDKPGAYIPDVNEEIVEILDAIVLTTKKAIHVTAKLSFKDRFGKQRNAGESWLLTMEDTEFFIPSPTEEVVATVPLLVLSSRQYCVVLDYFQDGKCHLGQKQLRRGRCAFFLHPGESLEGGGTKDVIVLGSDEALALLANEKISEKNKVVHEAGDRWLLRGPCDYIPPVEVEILDRRRAIPLDINEGVYIRDIRTGVVRAHVGSTVMLTENEELWNKPLEPLVEQLLALPRLTMLVKGNKEKLAARAERVQHKVVTCNVPHNALVQVYDYKAKDARVECGPALVMLMPDEEFTVLSLSGGKPKEAAAIKSLCLHLGPDFMTDIITVETSDHARLRLQLSYNWEFDHSSGDIKKLAFSVPDFVGDVCKAIASRIRGFVANESFDSFHKNSSSIIKLAVFGQNKETKQLKETMIFSSNGLKITNIDIHSVDPVDPKTREALTKSVQLAIEITTKSQEAAAQHTATTLEQQSKGRLERQVIADKALSEKERKELLEIEASNAAIESTGASKAQSKAQAESKLIEGEMEVAIASRKAEATSIMSTIELELQEEHQSNEIGYREALYDLEIAKTREMAKIEAEKFRKIIAAVGKDTIKAIAKAGPELQARLLQGLGLQGYLVTDGTNPINLFNTAKGMTATPTARQ